MSTTTLSIRIRKDLKEKMANIKGINWREEIEKFIEEKIKEVKLKETLNLIDELLYGIPKSKEPAWKIVRKYREER